MKRRRRSAWQRKPKLKVRTVRRAALRSGIYRFEVHLNTQSLYGRSQRTDVRAEGEAVVELLKRSAGGRFKVIREQWDRIVSRVHLESASDLLLIRMCHAPAIYKIFEIEVADTSSPGELGE